MGSADYPDDAWLPCRAYYWATPLQRSPETLMAVVAQFGVSYRQRYQPRRDEQGRLLTYCNVFASDVTDALGAPIPHWVDAAGAPCEVGKGSELGANATCQWLDVHGSLYGWQRLESAEQAAALAQLGRPTVACWHNPEPGHSGHIAVVVPPMGDDQGLHVAQAGLHNFSYGSLAQGFGPVAPQAIFYGHE